nr:hypothetical protein [Tanacetum cinerariifolium]
MANKEQAPPQQEMAEIPVPFTPFTRSLVQYKEYLSEFWYSAKALDNSKNIKDVYGDGDITIHPTQIFSVNNWALNPNHTKGPPFTSHMLAICNAEKPMAFKAPRTSSQTEKKVSQGKNLRAKAGHKKQSTSSKQPPMSSSEATKGGSFKAPTGSKTSLSSKIKEPSSANDLKPSQPSVSTPIDTGIHKEDQQTTGGPTSLGVTSEERAYPRLSSDKTKSVSDGLKTILATPKTGTKNAAKSSKEIKFREIKLEDLAKLVPNVKADFKDLDSPEDDPIIVVDDSKEDEEEDKNEEIHLTTNDKTKDISASIPPSPRSTQIQELTNHVLLLQSQKHTLETEKTKAEAKIARLKAQHPSPNVGQINELLIKSLSAEFSKILSAHDFYNSLPIELKELISMFNELINEVKALKTQVHGLEIKVPGDPKELPTKLEEFTTTIASLMSQVAKLKSLGRLLGSVPEPFSLPVDLNIKSPRDIESKEIPLPINAKSIEELSYLSNKLKELLKLNLQF